MCPLLRLAAYGNLRYLKWMNGFAPVGLPIKLARKNNKKIPYKYFYL
jgi:hypothetical protein